MRSWTRDDFVHYFEALYGTAPFPWQRRLAEELLREPEGVSARFPDLLDIPTGLGKTSMIDLALFFLAARPELAPRRILYVIDRRVVVDQAAERARAILSKLVEAKEGVLFEVAGSLRSLFGGKAGEDPFEISVMRGGMPKDEAWARRPDRPVVVLGTVDQIGSRLLFRGYGVSSSMAPVHAGLLGHDALFLLDEVQLSTAFAETLRAIANRYRRVHCLGALGSRWALVQMSATPITEAESQIFGLEEDDLSHPIIARRLGAKKLAKLAPPIQTSRANPERSRRAIVESFSTELSEILARGAMRIAIMVNRVDTALALHHELCQSKGERFDLALLTGRMRPLDREELLGRADDSESLLSKLVAGDGRMELERPVVVVSTQTLEAGADFDFEALITECASLDALKQRFGRLDRRGLDGVSHAVILIQKDQAAAGYRDPIYGEALSKTWGFLSQKSGAEGVIDFGFAGFPALAPDEKKELSSPITHAPVLLPAHLDALSETQPRCSPGPEPSLFLHGPRRGGPEVRVIWRADVEPEALLDEEARGSMIEYLEASLEIAPASSLESLSLPLAAFRAFIDESRQTTLADVEGVDESLLEQHEGRGSRREKKASRPFFIVEPKKIHLATSADEAYPEATILLPAGYGGLRDGNWDPCAKEPVRDLGDEAQFLHRGKPVMRLVPALFEARGLSEEVMAKIPQIPEADNPDFSPRDAIGEFLTAAQSELSPVLRDSAELLLKKRSPFRPINLGDRGFFAVTSKLRRSGAQASSIVNDDAEGASFLGREIGLDEHLADVRRWVRRFAEHLGLPDKLRSDLELAARLHDIGKADPRFQQLLRGGVPGRGASGARLLAKSQGEAGARVARELARMRSGYPKGYRHEMLSVAMLEAEGRALEAAFDRDLVLHLVGSHHGWGRPFAPASSEGALVFSLLELDGIQYRSGTNHELASFGSSVGERFWSLTERYGWWTLAFLEALLRLADHRASEEESLLPHANTHGEKDEIEEGSHE